MEAAYVGNRGELLLRQPDVNRASFDELRANAALPAAQRVSTNYLRPYRGYSAIRMRMSDAESEYNSLQLYATKRRGQILFTVSYTLGKVTTNASGNGDNDTAEAAGRSRVHARAGNVRSPSCVRQYVHLPSAVPASIAATGSARSPADGS